MTISQGSYNILHGTFLALNIIGIVWYTFESRDLHYLVKYFSLQGYWLAIFYSFTSFLKRTKQSHLNQVLFQLALTSNIIISLGYWIIVRPTILGRIPDSFIYCNDLTHTVPIVMLILISYLQNLDYFQMKNIKYQIIFMTLAIIVNVAYTFWQGPLYTFMTYEDIGTAIFLFGGFGMLLLNFVTMNKITTYRQSKLKAL